MTAISAAWLAVVAPAQAQVRLATPSEISWPAQPAPQPAAKKPGAVPGQRSVFVRTALQDGGDVTNESLKFPAQQPIMRTAAQFGNRTKSGDEELDFTVQ